MREEPGRFAEVHGARLYYEAAGHGEPLVMLHSHLVDSDQWDEQFAYFATTRQVIRFDARGFGRSTLPPHPFAYYEDLHGLLTCLAIARADLLGCSGGGMTILDFAVTYPHMVGKMVLVGTAVSGYQPKTPPPEVMMAMNKARHERKIAEAVELSLQGLTDGPRRKPGEVNFAVREKTRAMTTKLFMREPVVAAQPQWPQPPTAERLSTITAPTLAIIGSEDQPPLHEMTELVVERIPNAQHVVIPNAGHHPNMEEPTLFQHAVEQFLRNS